MCRFIAYKSNSSILLKEILEIPENSLVNQSKCAKEGTHGINADGFGIGWYDHSIDDVPGLYKSIQPAWNDHNLSHIISKIQSDCFIGHVRSSTVGDVNIFNCHPFSYNKYLYCHNGTIRGFSLIRRKILGILSNTLFDNIKGQTDSELLFSLILDVLTQSGREKSVQDLASAIKYAFEKILFFQKKLAENEHSKLNIIFTDGENLVATRYSSDTDIVPLSLYYCTTEYSSGVQTILIASEPINKSNDWKEVPTNHMILIDGDLRVEIKPIN